MLKREDDLLRELYCKIKYQGLGPKTIVEYTREPFVYAAGNDPGNAGLQYTDGVKRDGFSQSFLRHGSGRVCPGDIRGEMGRLSSGNYPGCGTAEGTAPGSVFKIRGVPRLWLRTIACVETSPGKNCGRWQEEKELSCGRMPNNVAVY